MVKSQSGSNILTGQGLKDYPIENSVSECSYKFIHNNFYDYPS